MFQYILCATVVLVLVIINFEGGTSAKISTRFQAYMENFNKTYEDEDETMYRFKAFLENEEKISRWNELEGALVYGWTEYADLYQEEFEAMFLMETNMTNWIQTQNYSEQGFDVRRRYQYTNFSWLNLENMVGPVQNQGPCGSCWAFTTAAIVGTARQVKISRRGTGLGNYIVLSAQEVLDCTGWNCSCNGGYVYRGLAYARLNGIASSQSYPYLGYKQATCQSYDLIPDTSGFQYLTPTTEYAMPDLMVNNGLIAVLVNASTWQLYKGEIITTKTCTWEGGLVGHAVVMVGYANIDTNGGYWIIQNSWGTRDNGGYVKLKYGENTCGLALWPLYLPVN